MKVTSACECFLWARQSQSCDEVPQHQNATRHVAAAKTIAIVPKQ